MERLQVCPITTLTNPDFLLIVLVKRQTELGKGNPYIFKFSIHRKKNISKILKTPFDISKA